MIELIERKVNGFDLKAPLEWHDMNSLERSIYSNGCGPKTKWGLLANLVPDSFYGLNVRPACDIHDYCWEVSETREDFEISDEGFRSNLFTIIESVKYGFWKRWLLWLRSYRAVSYYRAVREVGRTKGNSSQ